MKNSKKTSKKSKKNAKPGFISRIKLTKKNMLTIIADVQNMLYIGSFLRE